MPNAKEAGNWKELKGFPELLAPQLQGDGRRGVLGAGASTDEFLSRRKGAIPNRSLAPYDYDASRTQFQAGR